MGKAELVEDKEDQQDDAPLSEADFREITGTEERKTQNSLRRDMHAKDLVALQRVFGKTIDLSNLTPLDISRHIIYASRILAGIDKTQQASMIDIKLSSEETELAVGICQVVMTNRIDWNYASEERNFVAQQIYEDVLDNYCYLPGQEASPENWYEFRREADFITADIYTKFDISVPI